MSSNSGMLLLYEIGQNGVLRRADALRLANLSIIHDFAVTAKHLVFLLPPLIYDVKRRESVRASFSRYCGERSMS